MALMKILVIHLFLMLPLAAAEFRSDWQGTRPWVGPEYWAGPLYDWKTVDGAVVAVAAKDRLLHLLSHQPVEPQKGFQMRVSVELLTNGKVSSPAAVWAGMAVGVKGMMQDPRHIAVWPKQRIAALVRADGRLSLGPDALSEAALTGDGPVELELTAKDGELRLTGTRNGKSASVTMPVKAADLTGNLCLAASSPRQPSDKRGEIRARFRDWRVSGEGIGSTGVEPFGPILWTQYTRQGNRVKLSAQLAPMGESDAKEVKLDLKDNNEWREIGAAGDRSARADRAFPGRSSGGCGGIPRALSVARPRRAVGRNFRRRSGKIRQVVENRRVFMRQRLCVSAADDGPQRRDPRSRSAVLCG